MDKTRRIIGSTKVCISTRPLIAYGPAIRLDCHAYRNNYGPCLALVLAGCQTQICKAEGAATDAITYTLEGCTKHSTGSRGRHELSLVLLLFQIDAALLPNASLGRRQQTTDGNDP
jgi:hypothetical protein